MKNQRGFSLVEMLVALAVLSIILVALNQILVSTSQVTLSSFKHIEADTEARLTLDRISYDVSKMVQRSDVDYYFPATPSGGGNDQFYFFSESAGYFLDPVSPSVPPSASAAVQQDPRGQVSLVGYRIDPNQTDADYAKFERLSKGLIWNGVSGGSSGVDAPMIFLPQTIAITDTIVPTNIPTGSQPPTPPPATWSNLSSDPNFQLIGDGVFRLSVSYLVENSGLSHTIPAPVTPTTVAKISNIPNLEGIPGGQTGYFNPKDVLAIVVSIAVLDPNSQKLVPAATLKQTLLQTATSGLPSPAEGSLPLTTWENNIFTLGLPKEAAAQVRFYQRFCYLNHPAY